MSVPHENGRVAAEVTRRKPMPGKLRMVTSAADSTLVLLAVLVAYNVGIHVSARNSQRRHMLATLESLPPTSDCVFLGNSLVEAGCDTTAFKEAWSRPEQPINPINVALGATTPVEHYLILKRALEKPLAIKYLIYGFFDDQLNAPTRGDWADLIGNRAFSYYFPSDAARFYAPGSSLKKWELWTVGHIPMLAERSSLWGKVELLRRHFEDVGMPRHKTNRFGRVDDFGALEAKDVPSFVERCGAVMNKRQDFSLPIREIIRLGQEHGARVILVEMPMPSRHRQLFYSTDVWRQTRDWLESLAARYQATYLPASEFVQNDVLFEDATHLTEEGAKVFSARLAECISGLNH